MVNLNDFASQAKIISERRGQEKGVIPALKHCAGEICEAVEAWTREPGSDSFSLELADIIICVLTVASETGTDIEKSLTEAMIKNAERAYGKEA